MRTYRTKEKKYTCNEIRFLNVAIAPAESSVASLCVDVETDDSAGAIATFRNRISLHVYFFSFVLYVLISIKI